MIVYFFFFFFSSRRRHTRLQGDWSSDVCSSDLCSPGAFIEGRLAPRREIPVTGGRANVDCRSRFRVSFDRFVTRNSHTIGSSSLCSFRSLARTCASPNTVGLLGSTTQRAPYPSKGRAIRAALFRNVCRSYLTNGNLYLNV